MICESAVCVWSEPSTRPNMRMVPGDVKKALDWFESHMGRPAKTMTFYTKNLVVAGEVPSGIEVKFSDGCMGWEIWIE